MTINDKPTVDAVAIERRKAETPAAKRRNVVRVLKSALHDAQRELALDRVTGIFGIVTREDGTASVLAAVAADEMKLVLAALPAAIERVTGGMTKVVAPPEPEERGQ